MGWMGGEWGGGWKWDGGRSVEDGGGGGGFVGGTDHLKNVGNSRQIFVASPDKESF